MDIENRIEVTESVKKQIKENKVKLEAQKIKPNKTAKVAPMEFKEVESSQHLDETDKLIKKES
jgi:hypothetical protein